MELCIIKQLLLVTDGITRGGLGKAQSLPSLPFLKCFICKKKDFKNYTNGKQQMNNILSHLLRDRKSVNYKFPSEGI
jgi:hypothetical protein